MILVPQRSNAKLAHSLTSTHSPVPIGTKVVGVLDEVAVAAVVVAVVVASLAGAGAKVAAQPGVHEAAHNASAMTLLQSRPRALTLRTTG